MIYIEFDKCKKEYNDSYNTLKQYTDIKEMLFIKTLPSSVKLKKDKINGNSKKPEPFYEYIKKKDEMNLDTLINEAEKILYQKKELLDMKRLELLNSKDWYDIIYCYYFLDGLSMRKISQKIPYSLTQISRIIKMIKKELSK